MAIYGVGAQGSVEPTFVPGTEEAAYLYANNRVSLTGESQIIYISYTRVNGKDIWIEEGFVCSPSATAKETTMKDYITRAVVTRRVEFIMEAPAPWSEVYTMISHAKNAWIVSQDKVPGSLIPDDAIMVTAGDNEIIVYFMVEKDA